MAQFDTVATDDTQRRWLSKKDLCQSQLKQALVFRQVRKPGGVVVKQLEIKRMWANTFGHEEQG